MSCNCKKVRKIEKLFINNNNSTIDQKGVKYYLIKSLEGLISVVNKLITLILLVILTPLVILILIFNYIFKNKLAFILPKKLNKKLSELYGK